MIDVRKELHEVGFQVVAVPTQIPLGPVDRPVRTFVATTGVAVVQESPLVERLQHPHHGVMHHAVAKRCGADLPPLGVVDVEVVVLAGPVRPCDQFSLQAQQVFFPSKIERRRFGPRPFLAAALGVGRFKFLRRINQPNDLRLGRRGQRRPEFDEAGKFGDSATFLDGCSV